MSIESVDPLKVICDQDSKSASSQKESAMELCKLTDLESHPVAGNFKVTWTSSLDVQPAGKTHCRKASSSIYFLLQCDEVITWHILPSDDELLFFHKGSTLKVHMINKEGEYSLVLLGDKLMDRNSDFQIHIPHNHWYAMELVDKTSYAFYSEVVAPGFELDHWHAGNTKDILAVCPGKKAIIERLG